MSEINCFFQKGPKQFCDCDSAEQSSIWVQKLNIWNATTEPKQKKRALKQQQMNCPTQKYSRADNLG